MEIIYKNVGYKTVTVLHIVVYAASTLHLFEWLTLSALALSLVLYSAKTRSDQILRITILKIIRFYNLLKCISVSGKDQEHLFICRIYMNR